MSRTTTRKLTFKSLPRKYDGLAGIYLPRPIHDEVELENALEMVELMAGHDLTDDQRDYLEILSSQIEVYEEAQHPVKNPRWSVQRKLRYLMEESAMNVSDLGRLVGDRTLGSRLLSGERQLSKTMIRKLCQHFKLSADYFL